MTDKPTNVEQALLELQRLVREPMLADPPDPLYKLGHVPEEFAPGEEQTGLHGTPEEIQALELLRWLLPQDLRFEHIDKSKIESATFEFVCRAHYQPDEDHVPQFVADHAQALLERTCFLPIVHLKVKDELHFQGCRLLPAAAVELPGRMLGPDPSPTMDSVLAVNCTGTSHEQMSIRATEVAHHAIRLLRVAMREDKWVHDRQLRFRLGESLWFSDGASGWQTAPDLGWEYVPDEPALERATSQPLATLPLVGNNDVERGANTALRWFERAQLATDPLVEMLYLFFALEALIGDSEREKGRKLAARRAILGLKTSGYHTDPGRIYFYYGRVRSTAVHGGDPGDVPRDEIDKVSWDMRRAINEFLEYAKANSFTERSWIVKALDSDPHRDEIIKRFLPRRLAG
jgi:hypothetical protein